MIANKKKLARTALIHLTLIIASIIAIYPVVRVITVSIRPGDRLLSTSLQVIPDDANLSNYGELLVEKDFLLWVWNSLLITLSASFIGVSLAATSAYAFSRWRFRGRNAALAFLLATQMIPAAMLILPIYILAARLGMINTLRGIILASSISSIPFSIWILKGYYDTVPYSLEEAAMIDGAPQIYAFWRIIIPMSTPALSITFLFNFITAWKDFLLARVMLQRVELFTWPLGLRSLQDQFRTEWGVFAAASVLVGVPVVILFIYSSKYLVSGLTLGSVKE